MTIYERNFEAIQKLNPDFATALETATANTENWYYAEQHKDGYEELYAKEGVRTRPVYGGDPVKQVQPYVKHMRLYRQNATIIIGAGLGHALAEVLKRAEPGHSIIMIEPSLRVLRMALERYDYSKALKSEGLYICINMPAAMNIISLLDAGRIIEEWNIHAEPYAMWRVDYNTIIDDVMKIVNAMRCNTGTLMGAGPRIAINDIETLPYIIRHRGVAELKDVFKGKPAVLVSTGPSLGRNIHLLKAAQDKVVIIAVGQALRPLLAYDIRPDLICTVDFGEVNFAHFEGLLDSDVPMLTLNRVYAPLTKTYKGPKFISVGPDTLHGLLAGKGMAEQGGSVAHMVLGTATWMGCDPLIIIGQDLALSGESHFRQVDNMGDVNVDAQGEIRWAVQDPGSTLVNRTHSMGGEQYLKGYFGSPVLTNTGLMTFHTTMEAMCRARTEMGICKVINATEGGARIRGTEPLFLFAALEKYAQEPFDKQAPMKPLLGPIDDSDDLIDKAISHIEDDLKIMDEIKNYTEKALVTCDKLLSTISRNKLTALLDENEILTIQAHEAAKKLQPIALSIFAASRNIAGRQWHTKKKAHGANLTSKRGGKELMKTRVKRNRYILQTAQDAVKELRKPYQESLAMLLTYKHHDKTALDPTGEPKPPDLFPVPGYFRTGNWAWPLLETRRVKESGNTDLKTHMKACMFTKHALILRRTAQETARAALSADIKANRHKEPRYHMAIEEGGEMGQKHKDFEQALGYMLRAHALVPEGEQGMWGLATCYHHLCMYEESLTIYKVLMHKFPEALRYRYEYGQVLIKAGAARAGLKHIALAMKGSSEFDHFLKVLGDLYSKHGLIKEAEDAYTEFLRMYPGDKGAEDALKKLKGGTQ